MARESRFVSLVIPAHNEMGNISTICRVIADVMQDRHYEIIIVNDGSRDETLTEIKRCHAQDPHVQFISLSRNFGHQMAVKAGLEHARGDCVIT
ncbi:MAG: glycosyltransferase, partial [Methylococcales bacterium]